MKKVLVTGGSGFVGSYLLRELLSSGVEVVSLDRNSDPDQDSRVHFVQGDIGDSESVRRACRGVDTVFHCIAEVPLSKNSNLFQRTNIDGTRNLAKSAKTSGVEHFVYLSSSAVFGVPSELPVTEAAIPSPREPYGLAKLEGERICQEILDENSLTIVRPRTVLGAGRLGLFQILFEWIYEGSNVPVFSRGANLYQFVHAQDLARALVLIGNIRRTGIYHCGTEVFGTMREALEDLCRFADSGSRIVSLPHAISRAGLGLLEWLRVSPLARYHALMYGRSLYFDLNRIKMDLNWTSKYSNSEMLIESYRYYIENRASILSEKEPHSRHRSPLNQRALRFLKSGLKLLPGTF